MSSIVYVKESGSRASAGRSSRGSLYLGIDTGTSACKAVLLDRSGRVAASAAVRYSTRRTADGEVSQDPRDWLRAVGSTVRACLQQADSAKVEGIGVTAPAHVGVLLDAAGVPLGRSLLCFDARPEPVAAELRGAIGRRFYETTYAELTSAWTFPQLVWLRRTLGERSWSRVATLLPQKDYVRFCLTGGAAATDPSDATGLALLDQRTQAWSPELCAEAGLVLDRMPPIFPVGALAGGLTKTWARRLSLRAGTPIAVGGTDTVTELVSVAALEPGNSIVKIASTGTVVGVSDRPRPDPGLLTYPLGLADLWYSVAATNTAATAYNWFRSVAGDGEPDDEGYGALEASVARTSPGADGALFLPFLEGERVPYWDRQLRGAFIGLTSAHTRAHLVRAVMEGVALSLRDCAEAMQRVGVMIDGPCFTGGGVRSTTWRRILASALGRRGYLAEPHGPAVGAALLAEAACREAPPRPRPRRVPVEPAADWVEHYDFLYRVYAQAAHQVRGISHALGQSGGA